MKDEGFESLKPIDISSEFSTLEYSDLRKFLRLKIKENPAVTFTAVLDWVSRQTVRKAKACLDDSTLNIKSITVRATRQQYQEDVNSFESGVRWEEVSA